LSKYTELHPLVQQKEAEVQALKAQLAADSTNTIASSAEASDHDGCIHATTAPAFNPELDIIRAKLLSLEEGRVQLVNKQREAELYVANPPGEARLFAPATLNTVHTSHRRLKIAVASVVGSCLGLACSFILILLTEFVDGSLKTAEDVRRVTKLPVLTTLGDMENMGDEARVAMGISNLDDVARLSQPDRPITGLFVVSLLRLKVRDGQLGFVCWLKRPV
jgi:hypothetical protein